MRDLHLRFAEDDARGFFNQQLECRQGLVDAGDIGDDHLALFFLERHVVIHAHQHALAPNFQIVDRQLRHKNKQGRKDSEAVE